jgi:hypothetical protein
VIILKLPSKSFDDFLSYSKLNAFDHKIFTPLPISLSRKACVRT